MSAKRKLMYGSPNTESTIDCLDDVVVRRRSSFPAAYVSVSDHSQSANTPISTPTRTADERYQ